MPGTRSAPSTSSTAASSRRRRSSRRATDSPRWGRAGGKPPARRGRGGGRGKLDLRLAGFQGAIGPAVPARAAAAPSRHGIAPRRRQIGFETRRAKPGRAPATPMVAEYSAHSGQPAQAHPEPPAAVGAPLMPTAAAPRVPRTEPHALRAHHIRIVTELAARQHGLVTRAQLLECGVPPDAVYGDVRSGRLRPVHRGIYVYGPLTSPLMVPMAAVLACGEGSFVSHRTAADLWEIFRYRDPRADVSTRRARGRPGIRIHRVRTLEPDEVTRLDGVPITTPARTLLDIASCVSTRDLEQAYALAERRQLVTRAEILALLDRHRRRPGARALREVLQDAPPGFT